GGGGAGGGAGGAGGGRGAPRSAAWASCPSCALARLLEGLPDARGGGGGFAERDAEFGQRVFHRVDDGRRSRDGAALAHALDAQRGDDRAVLGELDGQPRHVV